MHHSDIRIIMNIYDDLVDGGSTRRWRTSYLLSSSALLRVGRGRGKKSPDAITNLYAMEASASAARRTKEVGGCVRSSVKVLGVLHAAKIVTSPPASSESLLIEDANEPS